MVCGYVSLEPISKSMAILSTSDLSYLNKTVKITTSDTGAGGTFNLRYWYSDWYKFESSNFLEQYNANSLNNTITPISSMPRITFWVRLSAIMYQPVGETIWKQAGSLSNWLTDLTVGGVQRFLIAMFGASPSVNGSTSTVLARRDSDEESYYPFRPQWNELGVADNLVSNGKFAFDTTVQSRSENIDGVNIEIYNMSQFKYSSSARRIPDVGTMSWISTQGTGEINELNGQVISMTQEIDFFKSLFPNNFVNDIRIGTNNLGYPIVFTPTLSYVNSDFHPMVEIILGCK